MQAPQPYAAPSGPPVCICPGCGVIAPSMRQSCLRCNTAFGPAPLAVSGRVGGAIWICITECDFQCRGCGLRSPLHGFDVDGEVECQRCGLNQAFDTAQWKEALEHVHAVGDLSGPSPEGRNPTPGVSIAAQNPHRTLGVEHTQSEHTQQTTIFSGGGMRQLTLRTAASPGHPLCRKCHAPLDAQPDGRGGLESACPRCGDRARYALPPGTQAIYPALVAVIGEEHRLDRPAVKVGAGGGGAVAITCPSCGAALPLTSAADLVTCAFCKAVARVPMRAWCRVSGEKARFEPFWVLVAGQSPKRLGLTRGGHDDDDFDHDSDAPAAPAAAVAAEIRQQVQRTQAIVWGVIIAGIVLSVVITLAVTLVDWR